MDQGFNAGVRIFVYFFQSVISKNSVLTCHRDYVGCNCRGHQIKVIENFHIIHGKVLRKGSNQFKTYTTTTQFLIWIMAIFLFWIENSNSWRQYFIGQMVIADDKFYS